jgi:hypothetical protein
MSSLVRAPESLLLASALVEVVGVRALVWLGFRSGRKREAAIAAECRRLETIRGDLGALLAEAAERTQAFDATLGAREQRLRTLLTEIGRMEGRHARNREHPAPAAAERATQTDPAEARLLRELAANLG